MSGNLQKADTIVKLVLAIAVIILYFIGAISGPLAQVLVILAVAVIVIFVMKVVLATTRLD